MIINHDDVMQWHEAVGDTYSATAQRVRPASEYTQAVVDRYFSPEGHYGQSLPWKAGKDMRFRPGETTVWCGMNGQGKSLMNGQVMLDLMSQGEKVVIASMEMKPVTTLARMARQAIGVESPTMQFLRAFGAWTHDKLWLYDRQGTVEHDHIRITAMFSACCLGATHFVIDSLMKCGIKSDDYNTQKAFVDSLTAVARDNNIHIHLIAHSRKGNDEFSPPGKMDVKGASEITDQVDNVLTVWRNKKKEREMEKPTPNPKAEDWPDALMICDKQRNGEWEGSIALWYHKASQQFIGRPDGKPRHYIQATALDTDSERGTGASEADARDAGSVRQGATGKV